MSDLGTPIEIAEIDSALRTLWSEDAAATRASLINFAIYSECNDCLESNTHVIASLVREHACRAILIASRLDAKEQFVNAWVTAHCQLNGGKKSICSEQITFELGLPSTSLIRNIVFAHLDSDLPLVLWWQGPFTAVFDDRLYSLIDRLIVDSSTWKNPKEEFRTLAKARSNSANRFILYDLTWARLLPYRLAIAGLFDHPAAAAALHTTTSLVVSHPAQARTQAAFLLAWLTTRNSDTLSHCTTALEEDPIGETKITFTTPEGTLTVSPTRDDRFLKSTVLLGTLTTEQIYPAGASDTAGVIARQLQSGGANTEYFDTLIPRALEILASCPR